MELLLVIAAVAGGLAYGIKVLRGRSSPTEALPSKPVEERWHPRLPTSSGPAARLTTGGLHIATSWELRESQDDDGYATFVREMWTREGIDLERIEVSRVTKTARIPCQLVSLVTGENGSTYVNLYEEGVCKSYATGKRHKWMRDGECFAYTAFEAVKRGADPDIALRHASHPDWIDHPLPPQGSLKGLVYSLEYASSLGEITKRVIHLQRVEDFEGELYVRGHCYLRNEGRSFRVSRILTLGDHRTGARITAPEAYFRQFIDPKAVAIPQHAAAMDRAGAGLKALLWIAQADSMLGEDEIAIALDYIAERQTVGGSRTASAGFDRDVARAWCEGARPIFDQVAGAIAKMPKQGKEAALVKTYIERMANVSDAAGRKRADKVLKLFS